MESEQPERLAELKRIGTQMAELRTARGLSRPQLAARLGRAEKSVYRWETGQQEMGVLDAIALAAELKTTVQALLAPQTIATVRTESLYFVSPERVERVRTARTVKQLADLIRTRPAVGIEIETGDVQVTKEQLDRTQREADELYDQKARGPLSRALARLRGLS